MSGWAWPNRSARDEKISLEYQASRFKGGEEPSAAVKTAALNRVLEHYPKTKVPPYFAGPKHGVTESLIRKVFPCLKGSSSPGMPYCLHAPTKAEVIQRQHDVIIEIVLTRLDALASFDKSEIPDDPVELLRSGLCDPVRVFIKNEPHSIEKIVNGRGRIISNVSMADEIIDRLLCSVQNYAEIDDWQNIPSKSGMGLSTDAQTKALFEPMKSLLSETSTSDVKGWDWSVPTWLMDMDVEARCLLNSCSKDSSFRRILENRIAVLARSVFVTSDGTMLAQASPGIVKSGTFITASFNSRMRVMLAYIIGALWAIAMGDDGAEQTVLDAVKKYEALGFTITDYKACEGDSFSFCSHLIMEAKAIPENCYKSLYKLLSKEITEEDLEEFTTVYRHLPEVDKILAVIRRVQ